MDRIERLAILLKRTRLVPEDWLGESAEEEDERVNVECIECESYRELNKAWRKALKWTDGLDYALSVMLASVVSVKLIGDQLWVKVIGPASCGKSTLCEAISTNTEFILAKSTIRGFHSGYKETGSKGEDNSLIPLITGKTLITKDGDTLLKSPNLSQILSEARDIYDGTSRTHYRNATSKDYMGIRTTWLLCGTDALREIDNSELGERFLDCSIMDTIDEDLEEEILWRVANRANRSMAIEADGTAGTQYEPEMTKAMGLTGGYVSYLRNNAVKLATAVETPTWVLKRCTRLGKFVSCLRARPGRTIEFSEREFSARLVSQHVRLAKCLTIVLNKKEVDDVVMKRVTQVSLDTARGQTLDIAKVLYESGENGGALRAISLGTNYGESDTRRMLRFLSRIKVTKTFDGTQPKGMSQKSRWCLTDSFRELFKDVCG